MKKILLTLLTLILLTTFTSASDVNFFKEESQCITTGLLSGKNLTGWGVIKTNQSGPYGTPYNSEDNFCLVMEPEQCDPYYHVSGLTLNPAALTNTITIKYFDGPVEEDNFFITITNSTGNNPRKITTILSEGTMTWKIQKFILPETLEPEKNYYLRFEHIGTIGENCSEYGQVAISSLDLTFEEIIPVVPEFSLITFILTLSGCVFVFTITRK